MKNRVIRDYNRRLALALLETENVVLKALSNNRILPSVTRATISSATIHKSEVRNLCRLTGRTRGIVRKLGISNLKFRQLADEGKLSGWRRASW